ncbi:MAG: nicotinate (nicotinamide) nucleotide adenylyltransferase [Akkermansiaceae bacterium]|nr:nicotinate (nicotinamide) nucleotide adenylyltransferase [Akkermansiaceae bacterium]MCF7732881.1 nicotinate (nicotinamide) nucleotide adenylyltransferase [Akkermansiaceae bacterium]
MAETRKIALFGGTFDPVHQGHLHLADCARRALGLDEVWFMPCRLSPHKAGSQPTAGADRLEMLRLATADLAWAKVVDFELEREGVSYSYQTAEALCGSRPELRWFWIMGGDQWQVLPQWRHPERLAACVEFIVFERDLHPVEPRAGFRLHRVAGDHPASATAIRAALREGRAGHPWLPPAVADWIAAHGIYRGKGGG